MGKYERGSQARTKNRNLKHEKKCQPISGSRCSPSWSARPSSRWRVAMVPDPHVAFAWLGPRSKFRIGTLSTETHGLYIFLIGCDVVLRSRFKATIFHPQVAGAGPRRGRSVELHPSSVGSARRGDERLRDSNGCRDPGTNVVQGYRVNKSVGGPR